MEPPESPGVVPANFEIQVPPDLEGGTYANFLNVWHSPYEFTFDFAVMQPPVSRDPEDPASPVTVPCRTVARLKIPPGLVFEIMRAINQNLTSYEQRFGEIPRPDTPQEEAQ